MLLNLDSYCGLEIIPGVPSVLDRRSWAVFRRQQSYPIDEKFEQVSRVQAWSVR